MAGVTFYLIFFSRSPSLSLSSLFRSTLNPRPCCDLAGGQMARQSTERERWGIVSSSLSVMGLKMLKVWPRLVDNITCHESIKAVSGVNTAAAAAAALLFLHRALE